MERATYKLEGMTCGGCVNAVTRALGAALPAAKVEVQLDGGLVVVEGPHEAATVERAVQDAGFSYLGVS